MPGREYRVEYATVEIDQVANLISSMPPEMINSQGNDVSPAFFDYILPLIQGEVPVEYENGIPKHFVLKK